MKRASRIFLSYAREDESRITEIRRHLQDLGLEVWMDRSDILAGEGWETRIEEAIRGADFFLACLSESSLAPDSYSQRELALARDLAQERDVQGVFILPLRLDEIDLPDGLAELQWLDIQDPDVWTKLYLALETARADRKSVGRRLESFAHRHLGWIALAALVAGNLALLAGRSRAVLEWLAGSSSVLFVRFVDRDMRVLVVVLLVAAYVVGFLRLRRSEGLRRRGLAATLAVAISATALLGLNLSIGLPPRLQILDTLDRQVAARLPAWIDRIFAWQHSSGGIQASVVDDRPQAWTTAQCLVGVMEAIDPAARSRYAPLVRRGLSYLSSSQLAGDNGGWGYWEGFDWAVTEINAWAALARIRALQPDVRSEIFEPAELPQQVAGARREVDLLVLHQLPGGGWTPTPEVVDESEARTYSTLMAVWVLAEALRTPLLQPDLTAVHGESLGRGVNWLLNHHDASLCWFPKPASSRSQRQEYAGLTAQALYVLIRAEPFVSFLAHDETYLRAKVFFLDRARGDDVPIAQNAQLLQGDTYVGNRVLEASAFLWYPWSFVVASRLRSDPTLSQEQRERAEEYLLELASRWGELDVWLQEQGPFASAESLYALATGMGMRSAEEEPRSSGP